MSGRGGDAGRSATAMPATTAAARGSASHVHRQPSSPIAPISGMPTIQAAGGPTSAHESARVRCSFGTHSAAATVPPTRRPATESPRRSWATRSTANVGAAALRADAAASPSAPPAITRRSGTLRANVPSAIAARPAARPDAVRSWPAAAVETSKIRGHLRQHGRQRDHARLSREQAKEERDPDRSLGPTPPIRRCSHCSHPQGIVPPRRPLGNGAGPCLEVRPATPDLCHHSVRGHPAPRSCTASRRLDQRHLRGFRGLRVR